MSAVNIKRELDGLGALAALAAPTPNWGSNWSSRCDDSWRNEWTGGASFEQAIAMARIGWPEGAARAQKLLKSLQLPPFEETHSVTQNDVTGSYVDVGEYVQGVPECMVDFREDTRKARFLSIRVSGVMACAIPAEEAMNRGVCIAAIVDALESRGIRCDVSLVFLNRRPRGTVEYTVSLKRATDPLNLDVIAFGVAHPACFRRLVFGAYENESKATRLALHVPGGYGIVTKVPESDGEITFQSPRIMEDWSPKAALEHIQNALRKAGEQA